jgi:Glycosyl transferase family 11
VIRSRDRRLRSIWETVTVDQRGYSRGSPEPEGAALRRDASERWPIIRRALYDISDGICAYLVGGFGNQLFILAAAMAQASRLGCPLYIDASAYEINVPDWGARFELADFGNLGFMATDITPTSPWKGQPLYSLYDQRLGQPERPDTLVAEVGGMKLNIFTHLGLTYDPRLEEIVPGTTIVGLYQSPLCFASVGANVRTLVESVTLLPREIEYVQGVAADPRVTVHVRRGDYLTTRWQELIGTVGEGYVSRAAGLYERLDPGASFRFYSDSPELIATECASIPRGEMAPPDTDLRSVAVMLAMAQAPGVIMSNSTFSWWSAWLLNEREPDAIVIAPRPWTKTSTTDDRLLPHWLTLGAGF